MSPDFSYADGALGFAWHPNSQVTFEVDNGANGSVDYQRTGTTDGVGNLNFRDYGGVAPFSIAEGDSVRMYDEVTVVDYVVVYVTLDDVDLASDILSGSAREGTLLDVRVIDPGQPFPGGPEISVTADASDHWSADFGGVFDIVSNSSGWVITVGSAVGRRLAADAARRHDLDGDPAAGRWRGPSYRGQSFQRSPPYSYQTSRAPTA
jgi:hypothetical protein